MGRGTEGRFLTYPCVSKSPFHLGRSSWLRGRSAQVNCQPGGCERISWRRDLGACSAVRGGCQGEEERVARLRAVSARSRLQEILAQPPAQDPSQRSPARVG